MLSVSSLLSLGFAVAAGALLFWTSQNVQQAEDALSHYNHAALKEEQGIRVLRAEWDYLNHPERLEVLAHEYLGLSSAAAYSISGEVSDLPEVFSPALPGLKPVSVYESAVYNVDGMSAPLPAAKPVIKQQKSFRSVLDELGGADAE